MSSLEKAMIASALITAHAANTALTGKHTMKKTDISAKVRKRIYERDKYCVYCGKWCGEGYPRNIAHLTSRGSGGLGIEENLYLVCPDCHVKEHNGELDRNIPINYLKGLYKK